METLNVQTLAAEPERIAYSIQESADLLGVNYFSVYRLRGSFRRPIRHSMNQFLFPQCACIHHGECVCRSSYRCVTSL